MGLQNKIYNIIASIVHRFGLYICRYHDCLEQGYVDPHNKLRITCPKCREHLGLPKLSNDWENFRLALIGAIDEAREREAERPKRFGKLRTGRKAVGL